ncbi:MAG: YebC/PmpR family DNA-binding transcriptional regulator [Candidatus Aenigmarchaeota archaeon]|nr:YebC/PmpR family DNA-binding transcriptional regulator [Candidatus Aenigmarchaeota archaeon]
MSGHSKWAGIKHQKAIVDKKKGKLFSKITNMMTVAAREGGGDPASNFKLRLAIERAKEINMPKDNIERAIKRGTGEISGAILEEITYEGYGPGGVALLIQVLTGNKNRAASEVRSILTRYGGHMGESGSVAWIFKKKGQIIVDLSDRVPEKEDIVLKAIDLGATDVDEEKKQIIIYCDPRELEKIKKEIESLEFKVIASEIAFIPKQEIKITNEKEAGSVLKLVEALEDLDDVSEVHTNFDIPESLIRSLI